MSRTYIKGTRQPRMPSNIARSAHRTGAGKHGGTARQNNRRDRKAARHDLRG